MFAPQNYCSRNIFPYEICVHTCLYLYDRILLLILFTRVLVNIAFGSIVAIVIRAVIDYSNFTTRREGLHIGRSLSFFHAKRKHVVLECGSRMEVILEVRQTRAGRQNASNKRDFGVFDSLSHCSHRVDSTTWKTGSSLSPLKSAHCACGRLVCADVSSSSSLVNISSTRHANHNT